METVFTYFLTLLMGVGIGYLFYARKLIRQQDKIDVLKLQIEALYQSHELLNHFLELKKKSERKRGKVEGPNEPSNVGSGGTQTSTR